MDISNKMVKLADCIRSDKKLSGKLSLKDMITAYHDDLVPDGAPKNIYRKNDGNYIWIDNSSRISLSTKIPAHTACIITVDFTGGGNGTNNPTYVYGFHFGQYEGESALTTTNYANADAPQAVINIPPTNTQDITSFYITVKDVSVKTLISSINIQVQFLKKQKIDVVISSTSEGFTQLADCLRKRFNVTEKLTISDMIKLFK